MEQMSKIFSNSRKGDIISEKKNQQTILMEMIDTPNIIKVLFLIQIP